MGQKVIRITTPISPLSKHKIGDVRVIDGLHVCSCGHLSLDVGDVYPIPACPKNKCGIGGIITVGGDVTVIARRRCSADAAI